jgi:hypothetical protein
MKGVLDFPALLKKNDQKLNKKKQVFQLKVRSNIKTLNEQKILCI